MVRDFGLSQEGFKSKTFLHIKSEIEAELLAKVEPTLILFKGSYLRHIIVQNL